MRQLSHLCCFSSLEPSAHPAIPYQVHVSSCHGHSHADRFLHSCLTGQGDKDHPAATGPQARGLCLWVRVLLVPSSPTTISENPSLVAWLLLSQKVLFYACTIYLLKVSIGPSIYLSLSSQLHLIHKYNTQTVCHLFTAYSLPATYVLPFNPHNNHVIEENKVQRG